MSRYIDADQFEVFYYEKTEDREDTFDDGVLFVLERIDKAPTEDVAPVVHAKIALADDGFLRCSACGKDIRYPLVSLSDIDYYPRCGAKMDEDIPADIPMEYFENGGN